MDDDTKREYGELILNRRDVRAAKRRRLEEAEAPSETNSTTSSSPSQSWVVVMGEEEGGRQYLWSWLLLRLRFRMKVTWLCSSAQLRKGARVEMLFPEMFRLSICVGEGGGGRMLEAGVGVRHTGGISSAMMSNKRSTKVRALKLHVSSAAISSVLVKKVVGKSNIRRT